MLLCTSSCCLAFSFVTKPLSRRYNAMLLLRQSRLRNNQCIPFSSKPTTKVAATPPNSVPASPEKQSWAKGNHRRQLIACAMAATSALVTMRPSLVAAEQFTPITTSILSQEPFVYSPQWTGTQLPWLSLSRAIDLADDHDRNWPMAKWPDPILRQAYVCLDSLARFGSNTFQP